MTKEQEEAIEMLEDIKNNTWTTKYIMSSDSKKAETVLNMLKEFVPKQKVKDKIKEIQEDKESEYYYMFSNFSDIQKCIEVLEELLEEKQ